MVRVFEYLNKYPDRHLEVRDTEIDVSKYTQGMNMTGSERMQNIIIQIRKLFGILRGLNQWEVE